MVFRHLIIMYILPRPLSSLSRLFHCSMSLYIKLLDIINVALNFGELLDSVGSYALVFNMNQLNALYTIFQFF